MPKRTSKTTPKPTPSLPAVRSTEGGIRLVAGRELQVDQTYFVQAVHPKGAGPWGFESDKVAWTDPQTGYGCIVLRSERTGALGAYVGVDPGHPLHGFDAEALSAAFDVHVHGGVSYSAMCQPGPESRTICHVSERPGGRGRRDHDGDHQWWFGCTGDQPYDALPPTKLESGLRSRPTTKDVDDALTRPREYRTEAYMVEQATSLAAQIHAIANGKPMPARTSAPPVGVDPRRSTGDW